MSPTDPPAADLGAPAAVERLRWLVDNAEYHKVPGQPAYFVVAADDVAPVLDAYDARGRKIDAQAARLADIWLLVDGWERGVKGGLETMERLAALRENEHVEE